MKNTEKAIYLHKNHTLIERPEIVYRNDPSYFNSPMVLKVWFITEDYKKDDWISMLTDAMVKGALPLDVKRIGLENGLSEKDINKIWEVRR